MLGPLIAYRAAILSGIAIGLIWTWYRVLRPKPRAPVKRSATVWTVLAAIAFLVPLSSPDGEGSAQHFMWNLWRSTP